MDIRNDNECDGKNALDSAIENYNLRMIKIILKHKDFIYFDASKYITLALTYDCNLDDLIETLFDKGGKSKQTILTV